MHKQQSKEWFKQRVGLITGSKVGAILGISPFAKPDDVMRDMVREYHGAEREFTGNIATEYGNENELAAIFKFENELNLEVKETGFHAHENGWLGASPDGLVSDAAIVEIKCPYGKRNAKTPMEFKSISEQPHYHAQMQIEMYCTGTSTCHFYQWSENASLHEVVNRDDSWLDANLPKLKAFHETYLSIIESEERSAPFLEDKEVDMSFDSDWLRAESDYISLLHELDSIKQKLEEKKTELLDMAKGRKCVSGSLTVFKTKKQGSISYAKAIKELCPDADLESYRGKETEYWTIKVK